MSRRLSAEERQALSELNRILSETPQWSGEEELCIEMEVYINYIGPVIGSHTGPNTMGLFFYGTKR